MKRYYIKCEPNRLEYLDILGENEEGYSIRVTRVKDGDEHSMNEFISHRLFDICLKTGYINQQLREAAFSVA